MVAVEKFKSSQVSEPTHTNGVVRDIGLPIIVVDKERLRDSMNSSRFVRLAQEQGLVPQDQDERQALEQELTDLFLSHNKPLSEDPNAKLKLVTFLSLVKIPEANQRRLRVRSYKRVGNRVNNEWFLNSWMDNESFMTRVISNKRRKAAIAQLGDKFKIKCSEVKGGIRLKTWPFLLRGFHPIQIREITGFSLKQIHRQKKYLFNSGVDVVRNRRESMKQAVRIKSIKLSEEEALPRANYAAFALKLIENGLITNDISSWEKLEEIYQEENRPLPEDLFEKLALEAFLRTQQSLKNGDRTLLDRYINLGDGINREWYERDEFIRERYFISEKIWSYTELVRIFPKEFTRARLRD